MKNLSVLQLAGIAGAIGILAVAVFLVAGGMGGQQLTGIDVSGTECDGIAAARAAVDAELKERKDAADTTFEDAMQAASDTYWETRRGLEDTKTACETEALLADPCKDLFEKSSRLAQEILDSIDEGFDQAKFDEREQVKSDYNKCLENPPVEETYEGKKVACQAAFAAGDAAALQTRATAEAAAKSARDAAIATANSEHTAKHGILNAIEEKCKEPVPSTGISAGGLTPGSAGTEVQSGSPACTGNFRPYDPEIQRTINSLKSQKRQAEAAGRREGFGGSLALDAKIKELEADMAEGDAKCQTDSDCGDTETVCCSNNEIGRVFCDGGVCANERTTCDEGEVCAGKPAVCVAPATGAQSSEVAITSSIVIEEPCNNTIQVLNLAQATPDSKRYEITGNIPSWLSFSQVGGSLPANVNVNASCSSLKAMGPGTYTASGKITVYNANNELINTIPLTVTVTVSGGSAAQTTSIAVIQYGNKYIPVSGLTKEDEDGCNGGKAHWHVVGGGSITATDGSTVTDPGPPCGLGLASEHPVMEIEVSASGLEVPGLDGRLEIRGGIFGN